MIRHLNVKCDAKMSAAFALLLISVFASGCSSKNEVQSSDANSASSRNKPQNTRALKISVNVVNRYIGFDKDYRTVLRDYLVERKAQLSDISAMAGFARQRDLLIQKWKLSDQEINACQELFGTIQTSRQAMEQLGGKQQLAEMEKSQQIRIPADAPEPYKEMAKRVEMQRQDAIAQLRRERDLTDVRAKFGDAVVDYVLQNGGEALKPLTDAMSVSR